MLHHRSCQIVYHKKGQDKTEAGHTLHSVLTTDFRASTTGRPYADTTIPEVKKYASSLHALLDSVSSACLLAIKFGIGDRM